MKNLSNIYNNNPKNIFSVFSVPPSKPKIILQPDNGNVEGYLGPYQIGTRLALSCQVFGGEIHIDVFFSMLRTIANVATHSETIHE